MNSKLLIYHLVTAAIFVVAGAIPSLAQNRTVFDISHINFEEQEYVELAGNWDFYWMQLVNPDQVYRTQPDTLLSFTTNWGTVDGYSPTGYGSYSAMVVLPESHPVLALDLPDFYSSYVLYVNGEEFARNGVVATSRAAYTPKWLPQTISLGGMQSDTLRLLLQVANFDHAKGGAYLPIKIGSSRSLFLQRYLDYGYSFILTGALLMGGMFFFGLYLFGRHETTVLYFSLFCIVYSYRIIGFGSYALHMVVPELPWILTLRLEYITLFLSGYIFGMYTLNLYPRESSRPLLYILSAISLLFLAISVIFPPVYFTQLVIPYFIILLFYLALAFYVYIMAVIHKQPGAIYSLISSGVVFIVFAYEILAYLGVFNTSIFLNFAGYLFFFFFQSLVLSYRFADNLKTALDQAKESSKAKSQFLSTMSHEIRTPLNAVIGLSGLLSESDLNEKQLDFTRTIKKSGESLLSIINNILDYSKIESGKLEIEHTEFNLVETVELVIDVVSSTINKPNIELLYQFEDGVPTFVLGDSTRLQQVLTNLVANAVKFTDNGQILVHVRVLRKHSDSLKIEFTVQDTGIGIPNDKLHRLFKSFSQVDASSTRKYGGTGLGLVISKRLIEAMHGEIEVESEVGTGSTFKFNIKVGNSGRLIEPAEYPLLFNKNVFIVDDNPVNLSIMTHQLEKAGVQVSSYHQGHDLIENLDTLNAYDFGILDMQMPTKDGIEVAQTIRKKWPNTELPLVLFSSVHELENFEDRKMFDLYLKKPIRQSKFLNNLERLYNPAQASRIAKKIELPPEKLFDTDFKVLVAEDNLINQKVAVRILERLGIHPDVVPNGQEAYLKTQSAHYDLILMDMEMPVLDGIEATKHIQASVGSQTEGPVIIAMTANALAEDRERCLEAGMHDFVSKPITVESLKLMLKKWLADD